MDGYGEGELGRAGMSWERVQNAFAYLEEGEDDEGNVTAWKLASSPRYRTVSYSPYAPLRLYHCRG